MTDTVRDILLAFVRVHVLHHAVSERVYGAGMAVELARHGYQLSPGTLYPLLHRLEQDGLLVSESEVVAGKVRKYYVATELGRSALIELKPRLAELVGEALPEDKAHAPARTRKPRSPR
jgi:DNA-binding PadR family transcriptional regulator